MENIQVKLNEEGFGKFYITEGEKELAKMEVSVTENYLTAYHTEVDPDAGRRGLAKNLFDFMISYVQEHGIKVIPLCIFVKKQLDKDPDKYKDLVESINNLKNNGTR